MTDRQYVAQTAALLAARAVSLHLSQGSHVAADDAVGLHSIATRLHRGCPVYLNYNRSHAVCHLGR